ncbi:putative tartrate transporter [subsurface metagenome]
MGFFQDKWGLTGAEVGMLGSAIYLSYFIFQIPSGLLADKWNRKNIMILGGILQGIAVVGCGYFDNVSCFAFFRLLTGIFSAVIFSSSFGYIASILPSEKKVMGIGIVHSFMPLGIVVGTVLTSEMIFRYDWNWGAPFIIFGLGIIFSSLILSLLTKGKEKQPFGIDEKNKEPDKTGSALLYMKEFSKNKNLFNLSIIAFIQGYTLFMIITWLPYFFRQSGFNALDAGNLSSFAYVLAVPATVIIAVSMGNLKTIIKIKKPLLLIMIVNILSILLIINSVDKYILIFALTIYGLSSRLSTAPLHIHLVTEFSKLKNYSKNLSIFNTFACLSMFVAPIITGFLFDLTGILVTGFYIAIFMEIIALLLMKFGISTEIKES